MPDAGFWERSAASWGGARTDLAAGWAGRLSGLRLWESLGPGLDHALHCSVCQAAVSGGSERTSTGPGTCIVPYFSLFFCWALTSRKDYVGSTLSRGRSEISAPEACQLAVVLALHLQV